MQLGMIGLGRMGANMVRRLMQDGHEMRGLRRHTPTRSQALAGEGGAGRLVARGPRREAERAARRSG